MKLVIFFLISIFFASLCFAQNVDINLLKSVNLNRNKFLDPTFKFITNSASPVSLASPVIIYSVGVIMKDSAIKFKGVYVTETILVSTIFSLALKYSVNRSRPFDTYPYLDKASSGGSPSFPSGHTADAFATATSLSLAFPKWYVIVPSFVWAGAVGYSRLDLGVHYPSDVLAGAVIGSGSAFLSYKINRWVSRRKAKHTMNVSLSFYYSNK